MKKRAFTVVELLVVIAIIAILGAILVSTVGGCAGETRAGKRLRQVEKYYDENGNESGNVTIYRDMNTGKCWKAEGDDDYTIDEVPCPAE